MNRPWLTTDRGPAVFAERLWQAEKWYDQAATAVWRKLFPALRKSGGHERLLVALVRLRARAVAKLSDEDLLTAATALRPRLLARGFTLSETSLAFALVREATFRELGFRHHPVQILGALQILTGRLAEMATGEGKTITAALAAATAALAGLPVHVITVNEYLSKRDFDELAPIYTRLGLSGAYVDPELSPEDKLAIYARSIVYVTNKSLVFDYLRSRLGRDGPDTAIRYETTRISRARAPISPAPGALAFCIVDEADSILIDEAQTPLIIAAPDTGAAEQDCRLALEIAGTLSEPEHFRTDHARRRINLTRSGKQQVTSMSAERPGLWRAPRAREEMITQALSAIHFYLRDQHYIVADDKVQIVDEFTGRVLADRQWQAGLHQMVEVKEGLKPGASRRTMSQITYQLFFRRYLWFGGMTGTGAEVARELRAVYGLETTRIPTHRVTRRRDLGVRLLGSEKAKLATIAKRAKRQHRRGRPVLIGTRSVAASEAVSEALTAAGLEHVVLNARHDTEEAAIIAAAGRAGAITVATNMAGRGTDIKLDAAARRAGGLHVILTEYHESGRVDRQLFGRAARQGDPGSREAIVSLSDDLFTRHAQVLTRLARAATLGFRGRLPAGLAIVLRLVAQGRAQQRSYRVRRDVLTRSEKLEKSLGFTKRPV